MPLPGLDMDACALVEFLSIRAHAVRRGSIDGKDRVLVVGVGSIGLGIALPGCVAPVLPQDGVEKSWMANGRITKRVVDGLVAGPREFVHWDGELTGIRVRPSGSKSFIAVYRTGGRNSPLRRVTIGTTGKTEADKAREEAKVIIRQAELGIERAAEKARARAEMTFAQLCDLYLAEGCDTKKPSTLVSDRGRIERHIKPLLGKKRVGEIERADVERFMRDVVNGKTATDVKTGKFGRAIVEGGRGTAARTVGLLGGIMSLAVSRHLRKEG